MPQPKITRSQKNGAPSADLSIEEAAQIRAAIGSKEKAPSSRVQSVFNNWREVADQLGDPFERERIPLSTLRQMRRDPMLGFGLSFIKTPHVRAKWHIQARSNSGPNAQVAAHLHHDLSRIYASFVLQWLNSLDFGFQAIAKRFEFRIPSGSYIEISEGGEPTEQPIWSEGGIEPICWKPFVPLRPEGVEPVWDKSTGEFAGIEYAPTGGNTGQAQSGSGGSGAGQSAGGQGGTNKEEVFKIDPPHSLWVTNEKDSNFGSIFGYPRLGYAYSYWWSYWFRWAIADRAFERKADPSVIVYHPDGEFINEDTGERMTYSEYALLMGERMRSGGVIALPSEVYEDATGKGTIRQWAIDFTKEAVNFDPFDKSFEYLDVQKLRALFIPEQAFLEGKGGTSSRNVAAEMGQSFMEAQAVLSSQIAETINRWLIPQWVAANYPEFMEDGGTAEIIIRGFGDEDTEFMTQLVQLIGQQESGMREMLKLADLKKILEDRGTPIVSFAEQQRREAQLVAEQQALNAPTAPVPAAAGGPAIVPSPSGTGFSYSVPREVIHLADTGTDFIENLPSTPHYQDTTIKGFSRIIWNLFRDLYREEYESAAMALSGDIEDIDEAAPSLERAQAMLRSWKGSPKWDQVFTQSQTAMRNIMRRAVEIEMARLRKNKVRPSDESLNGWVMAHFPEVIAKAAETTRGEVERFMALKIQDGVMSPADLAGAVRDHFSDFPQWKADRLIRTEVRDIYNAATLLAAQSNGYERVQALDSSSDPECAMRNGRILPTREAMLERDHPNGTLAWRAVPTELAIERRDPSEDFQGAEFDEERNVLTLSNDLPSETERKILVETVDFLSR